MWSIKQQDLAMKEKLSKMKLLDSLIAKQEPLADYEEALKKKLINELITKHRPSYLLDWTRYRWDTDISYLRGDLSGLLVTKENAITLVDQESYGIIESTHVDNLSYDYLLLVPSHDYYSFDGKSSWTGRDTTNFGVTSLKSDGSVEEYYHDLDVVKLSSASSHSVETFRNVQRGIAHLMQNPYSLNCVNLVSELRHFILSLF
ncbi:hypothetical protein F2Q69_00050084 [Brassica cretica]|uniref:Uncharacterized protein n=1 Tax=Brassica cretica TaxID=69181 RepID=A0A8S9Q4R2_BRACR|nr:hypothetical protein F2Q69_00050084 [Brassica cretica]